MADEAKIGRAAVMAADELLQEVSARLGRKLSKAEQSAVEYEAKAANAFDPQAVADRIAGKSPKTDAPVDAFSAPAPTPTAGSVEPPTTPKMSLGKKAAIAGTVGGGVTGSWALMNGEDEADKGETPPPAAAIQDDTSVGLGLKSSDQTGLQDLTAPEAPKPATPKQIGTLVLEKGGVRPDNPLQFESTVKVRGDDGQVRDVNPVEAMNVAFKETAATLNEMKAEYAAATDLTERREIWEGIMRGVALMAAGMYGLKSGVNMGGVKFEPTDWMARQQALLSKYSAQRQAAMDQLGVKRMTYDTLKSELDQKNQQIKTKWEANERAFDNAQKDLAARNQNAVVTYSAGMDKAKFESQLQNQADELQYKYAALENQLAKAKTAAAGRAIQIQLKNTKDLQKTVDAFNNTVIIYGKTKGSAAKESLIPKLMEYNSRYREATGRDLVAPEALENSPESFFGLAGGNPPTAGKLVEGIKAAKAGPTAPTEQPLVQMTAPDGQAYEVPADKVEAAKARGWK